MRPRPGLVAGTTFGVLIFTIAAAGLGVLAFARQHTHAGPEARDNPELARLFEADQADRMPEGGKAVDWTSVGPRDREREARVKALHEAGDLRTGKDYHRAAMVLQHASTPEDYLLAHEFCVVALAKGERDARWLAAATEDRLLMTIGRPQRFGTQYRSSGPDKPVKLYEVGPGVTDGLRRELGVPTLAEAREREARMQGTSKGERPSAPKP
jgi:hypothetical protein